MMKHLGRYRTRFIQGSFNHAQMLLALSDRAGSAKITSTA